MSHIEITGNCMFYNEQQSYSGVKKIANQVRKDIELVTDTLPSIYRTGEGCNNLIIYGTVGKSEIIDDLAARNLIQLDHIRNKWEVYGIFIVDHPLDGVGHALIIAGSDKRGTIYGLYHLSELLGVSPLVNWNHMCPKKRKSILLTHENNMISKEPSVKYRGFFINDEWPAFGGWATKHFGGINAACYERVFELLLRLKGNYLWPAMWNSNFSMDGPGLESAILADELGVVMSTSHHEPCMRAGEEFKYLSGRDTVYGDAWNFRKNEQGITRFWRDGLIRNKPFENVITMGMRGERDSAILGKDATLEDNINLLRDVLKTQNKLVKETISNDLNKVPRQIVLFTEVEEFFYGNSKVKGLIGDPELEGVTLMLSDNNFGYTRTLPSKEMINHKGGYGMYYHMDMHGGAYSYQWIGSTYLPTLWEQMTQAYEFGVREIWVTNIGDIGTQEFGLSFFLDLAYDIEKWGGEDCSITQKYTKEWVDKQFGNVFSSKDKESIIKMIWDYTGLLAKRKHEIMNDTVYHPVHFNEADQILNLSENILLSAERLKEKCNEKYKSAFISLFYYPACGTANLMKMWILAGKNRLFSKQNRLEANLLVKKIEDCVEEDERLIREYEEVDDEYYNGFGSSEHIGFTNWNDEDNKYPLRYLCYPAKKPRLLLSRIWDEHYMTGLIWCDKKQVWSDAIRQDVNEIPFDISNGSNQPFSYKLTTDCDWMSFSKNEGEVTVRDRITLYINKELFEGKVKGTFCLEAPGIGAAEVTVEAKNIPVEEGVFIESDGYIAMEASHFQTKRDIKEGHFQILQPYGRTGSAVKVFPSTADFYHTLDRPYVEYSFYAERYGEYELCFYLAPTTPVVFEREQYLGYSINMGEAQIVNTVTNPDIPFFLSPQWEREAMDCIKKVKATVHCKKGKNTLCFYGMSPGIVLERIILHQKETLLPESYLGPVESYRKKF